MAPEKKKVCLTLVKQSEILNEISKGAGTVALAQKYGVAKSTISGIKVRKQKILKAISKGTFLDKKRKSLKLGEFPIMENALYRWFVEQRRKNLPISGVMLQEKAKQFHQKYYATEGGFFASSNWLNRFKKRHGIRLLKVCGEKLSVDHSGIPSFIEKLHQMKRELHLTSDQIYNADESGLFWKLLPDKTFVMGNEKTAPGRKMEKSRITFLACTNATGEHKIKPLVIGKAKKPRSFKNLAVPVHYRSSKNAWMTADIFKNWFFEVFVPQVTSFLENKGLPKRAILILDNAPCHPSADLLRTENDAIFVLYMPPNATPVIQPMDQNVIRLTKLHYKKNLLSMAVGHENVAEFLKKLSLKDAVFMLALAWEKVTAAVIAKCWAQLLDKTDEDDIPLSQLREMNRQTTSSDPEIINIQNMVESILPPNILITADEILNWATAENSIVELENNEDDNDITVVSSEEEEDDVSAATTKRTINSNEAVKIFDKAIEWAEDNTTSCENLLVLKMYRDKAAKMCLATKKRQTNINNFFEKTL